MAFISRVEIKDFLLFEGEFKADFCSGVNVLIGENGTGKTTLLRGMYGRSNHYVQGNPNAAFDMFVDGKQFSKLTATVKNGAMLFVSDTELKNIVFIPESNILSHARGLLETVKYGGLHYEYREVAIIEQARILPNSPKDKMVEKIESVIGGTVELSPDGQSFYINKPLLGYQIDLLFEASGYQKLALLARLIHNGQICSGSIIFWDEPENSLNPELIPILVGILLELAQNGVQVFLATHDYNLARHFDVRKNRKTPVMFHNLSKVDNGRIVCISSPEYTKLPDNSLERANEDLFEAVVFNAMEENNNE
jgi:predicted ATPase